MAKVRTGDVEQKEKYKIIGEFHEIVSSLRTKKEVVDFFVGLFSGSETLMMARRIQIAKLITKGASYEDIRSKLKVGFDTIRRTDLWLNGEDENYNLWINKCIKKLEDKENQKNTKQNKSTNSLDKYAHHRLLKKIIS